MFSFSFPRSPAHPHLHSFPTRRSSDLDSCRARPLQPVYRRLSRRDPQRRDTRRLRVRIELTPRLNGGVRSEEHTSELQSHSDLVCRLLLEKKKKKKKKTDKEEEDTPPQ